MYAMPSIPVTAAPLICGTCNNPIPEQYVTCPLCVADKNKKHTYYQQKELIPAALAANGRITIAEYADGTHLIRLGAPRLALCGKDCKRGRRRPVFLSEVSKLKLCIQCAGAFLAITQPSK